MTTDTLEKLLLIVLGWLLGMLGPAVTESIKKRRESQQVKVALAAELREVAYKLAISNYLVHVHFGTVNRSYLQWLRGAICSYSGPSQIETTLPSIDMQLGLPEEQLSELIHRQKAREGKNINTQKILVPLLDARVSSLWYLEGPVQVLLLDIRSSINLLNEIVDQSRYFSSLTFGALSEGNYELVVENLDGCHRQYAERAKRIVDKIAQLSRAL
jgi:hypothetical protein